jgi:dihydrofolate reductase
VPEDRELVDYKLNLVAAAGAHLMGRVTYQSMAGYWPTSTEPYAAPMNEIPKVVFSKSLTVASWPQSRIASGDLATEIAALKNEPGADLIAYGGTRFAAALASQGLIEVYRLFVQPLALGAGGSVFAELTGPLGLELIESRAFECGVVLHSYRPQVTG